MTCSIFDFTFLISLFAFFLIILEGTIRRTVFLHSYIFKEFPLFNPDELLKFSSHDSVLGWEPFATKNIGTDIFLRPNSKGTVNKSISYNFCEDGSRYQPKTSDHKVQDRLIEFFGDSACLCRDVEDDKTFQYYLQEILGVGVCKNYGVGNYGADQALLRAERRMVGSGIAVMYTCAGSIGRLLSVYKHYSEPGNYWAVKPRFSIKSSGELRLVPRPFSERDKLAHLDSFKNFFRENDWHYEKFRTLSPAGKTSYTLHFLRNSEARALLFKRIKIDSKSGLVVVTVSLLGFLDSIFRKIFSFFTSREERDYFTSFCESEAGKIFAYVAQQFYELAISRGSRPLFIISPQGRELKHSSDYKKGVSILKNLCLEKGVALIDFGDALFSTDEYERARFNAYSSHLSAEGNYFLAKWLTQYLTDPMKNSQNEM